MYINNKRIAYNHEKKYFVYPKCTSFLFVWWVFFMLLSRFFYLCNQCSWIVGVNMSIILFVYRARYRVRVCPLTIGGGVGGHWYADFKEISSGTLGQPPKQDLRVNSACLNQYSIFKNSKKSSNAAIVNDYFGKIIDVITHSFFRYIVCI